jgi:hypothetical protein
MLQIAGGILIAFLVIITFPIWGNLLLALFGLLLMHWEIILGLVVIAVMAGVIQGVLQSTIAPSARGASVRNRHASDPIRAQEAKKPLEGAKTTTGVRKCANPNCARLLPRGVYQCPHCDTENI